ncbi:MAG TPA: PEP-CTERM sorting domain-containing protein, partial [Phycisphaerae bacterium]|nr:PEP-CTERM sorting domain-containing protein [Phycisphaerae bacterium]
TFSVPYTPSSSPGLVYTPPPPPEYVIGNFTIGELDADAYTSGGTSVLGFTSLQVTNSGSSTDTLNVTLGATSFPAPPSVGGGLALVESIGGEVTDGTLNLTETSYADPTNTQNSTSGLVTTPPLTLTNFTAGSSSNSFALNYLPPITGSGFNSPYSLTNVTTINLSPLGNADLSELNDNGDTIASPFSRSVPEPGGLAFLGVGAVGLLIKRRKKI